MASSEKALYRHAGDWAHMFFAFSWNQIAFFRWIDADGACLMIFSCIYDEIFLIVFLWQVKLFVHRCRKKSLAGKTVFAALNLCVAFVRIPFNLFPSHWLLLLLCRSFWVLPIWLTWRLKRFSAFHVLCREESYGISVASWLEKAVLPEETVNRMNNYPDYVELVKNVGGSVCLCVRDMFQKINWGKISLPFFIFVW